MSVAERRIRNEQVSFDLGPIEQIFQGRVLLAYRVFPEGSVPCDQTLEWVLGRGEWQQADL